MLILKDAYFYIGIMKQSKRFPRFTFGVKHTGFCCLVLPFGLVLLHTLTKYMKAALACLYPSYPFTKLSTQLAHLGSVEGRGSQALR